MRQCIFIVLLFLTIMGFLPSRSMALDYVSEIKNWEYVLSLGYTMHTEKYVDDSFLAGFRAQKRVAYPVLVGIGIDATYFQDIVMAGLSIPVTYRIGLGPLKLDAILKPGGAYAYNLDNKNDKLMGVITGGIEVKNFLAKGKSIGIGIFYSGCTYSDLDNFRFVFVYGF